MYISDKEEATEEAAEKNENEKLLRVLVTDDEDMPDKKISDPVIDGLIGKYLRLTSATLVKISNFMIQF